MPATAPTFASPAGAGFPAVSAQATGGRSGVLQLFSAVGQAHAQCKAKLRASPVGRLLGELRKPLSAMTGGLVASESQPNHVELAAAGPQGSAAQIKQDQLEAPQRLAAIQALGEVDCHWYPEAQAELLAALRSDRNECVRFEAAKILSRTACCTPATIQALRVCVAGTSVDGNPAERALRIRNQAACALERCLAMCGGSTSQQDFQLRPEYPSGSLERGANITASRSANSNPASALLNTTNNTAGADTSVQSASYAASVSATSPAGPATTVEQELHNARLILEQFRSSQATTPQATSTIGTTPQGNTPQATTAPAAPAASLLDVWRRAQ